jgi:hypothetical protein
MPIPSKLTSDDLPYFTEEELAGASTQQLLGWLMDCQDFAPRDLFEAGVARGEEMVDCLAHYSDRLSQILAENLESDEFWVLVHGVNLLGKIESRTAGELLVRWLREMINYDQNMFDWVADDWPYLFANKPVEVQAALDQAMRERGLDGLLRQSFARSLIAIAAQQDTAALDAMIDHIAAQLHDADDDPEFRFLAASALLKFPRERHRGLLLELARQPQCDGCTVFYEADVEHAFAHGSDVHDWLLRDPPWTWYDEEHVLARLQNWFLDQALDEAEIDDVDDPSFGDDFDFEPLELPHVRETPKIGRNDACPCGSGKKYKKCCMAKELH